MSTPTIFELVRKDLIARERDLINRFGTPSEPYTGGENGAEALLDAYDEAINLALALRQLIENITVGDGIHDVPGYAG